MVKRSNEGYRLRIPYNIYLDELLIAFPIDNVPNAKEYLLYIISLIRVNDPNSQQHSFTFIFSKELQKIVDNYKPLLLWLFDRGIIEIDWFYEIRVKSRGYRFTNAYNTPFKEVLVYKPTLIKQIIKVGPKLRDEVAYNVRVHGVTLADGSHYTFISNWISYKTIAQVLKLSSLKMKLGLIKYKLIQEPDNQNKYNIQRPVDNLYYYNMINFGDEDNRRISYHLMLNIEKLEIIRELALKYPSEFKRK